MALVRQRRGTEAPRKLVWQEFAYERKMYESNHKKGERFSFYVMERTLTGEPLYLHTRQEWDKPGGTRWQLSCSYTDGTGKVLHVASTAEECMRFAQEIVDRGE